MIAMGIAGGVGSTGARPMDGDAVTMDHNDRCSIEGHPKHTAPQTPPHIIMWVIDMSRSESGCK